MVAFSLYQAMTILQPLIVFIFSLALYAIVIYNLHKFVATRDIFDLNLGQYNTFTHPFIYKIFAIILYFAEYILFFPLFVMVWFIAFSIMLISMSTIQSFQTVLLSSMTIISSIRIVAYYDQEISREVAKLVPFALLAIVILEDTKTLFSWDRSLELIKSFPTMLETFIYYFAFVIFLEIFLRVVYGIARGMSRKNKVI